MCPVRSGGRGLTRLFRTWRIGKKAANSYGLWAPLDVRCNPSMFHLDRSQDREIATWLVRFTSG
jgi:hypothetical protein